MYDTVKAETFSEEECEYLLTLRKPLQTMYLHYEMDEGLYDSIGRTVAMMADNNISDYRVLDKEDFKTRMNHSQVSRHKKAQFFWGSGYFVCSQYKASASLGVSILSVPCGLFVL